MDDQELEQLRKIEENLILTPDYQALRRNEYPDFTEYLDGVVKGDQNQIDKYIEKCKAVKAKYPKG